MDALAAAVAILQEAGGPLHWTVIQDRALRAGHLDPFSTPNVRRELLTALRRGVTDGVLRSAGTGVYDLAMPAER
ncbi:MAG TPA: hypothetical protein VNC60_09775 [Actinomycetota bacterium]|nr:hypothetical protein [Actinomycetota bacterium]